MTERLMIRCRDCEDLFLLPFGVPLPDAGGFCPACQKKIEERIALNMMQWTGSPRGGVTLVDGHLIARQVPE